MELRQVLQCLGLDGGDAGARHLHSRLAAESPGAPEDWRVLAAAVARSTMPGTWRNPGPWPGWNEVRSPLVLGVAGAQGSGKTTLARALDTALQLAGARAAVCSLDDFYLPRTERLALAETVHPLFVTRGVPGTHDVALLRRTVTALGVPGVVRLPVFDKAADERLPPEEWRPVTAPVDVLVLEGWCVGAGADSDAALERPLNDLEAEADPEGVWRRHANDALSGPYAALWTRLDGLIFLEAPDMEAVLRWRGEQEHALPPERRMGLEALRRFVAHYERITRCMKRDLPARAGLLAVLDADHRVVDVRCKPAV